MKQHINNIEFILANTSAIEVHNRLNAYISGCDDITAIELNAYLYN